MAHVMKGFDIAVVVRCGVDQILRQPGAVDTKFVKRINRFHCVEKILPGGLKRYVVGDGDMALDTAQLSAEVEIDHLHSAADAKNRQVMPDSMIEQQSFGSLASGITGRVVAACQQ